MQHLFLELIRIALGIQESLSRTPSETEWAELYAMARKQLLIGICFDGVQRLNNKKQGPQEILYLQWMGMAAKIQQRNEAVNKQCVEIRQILTESGFRSCILKGQGVAQLYPEHLGILRQPGDIDIWVNDARDKVIDFVLRKSKTKQLNADFKNIHWNIFDNIEVEVHFKPVVQANPLRGRILNEYFDSEFDKQSANGFPTMDFQLVHQLLHVYQHYLYEGVTMKQMMDLYFTQCACMHMPEQVEKVKDLFARIGLMEFVGATQWVLQQLFGFCKLKLLSVPNERDGKIFLNDILYNTSGNSQYQCPFIGRFVTRMHRKMRFIKFDCLGVLYYPVYRFQIARFQREIKRKYDID